MTYQRDRDEFIAIAASEGLPLDVTTKLLRYASTLDRLAVAQCNGDYPYNGDRDRPNAYSLPCAYCSAGNDSGCKQCNGSGKLWHRDEEADKRHDKRYTSCPQCEASGVRKSAMRTSTERVKVCPDCRTAELVKAALPDGFTPIFSGDPRGCVLKLAVPSGKVNDWGKEGICVPSRSH